MIRKQMYYAYLVDSVHYSSANDITRKIWDTYETKKYFTYQTLFLLFLFPELYSIVFAFLCIRKQKSFYNMHATYSHYESKIFFGILYDPGCPLKAKANKKEGPYHCIFGTINTHRCAKALSSEQKGLTNFISIPTKIYKYCTSLSVDVWGRGSYWKISGWNSVNCV